MNIGTTSKRRVWWCSLAALLFVGAWAACPSVAQENVRLEALQLSPDTYMNRLVNVEGRVEAVQSEPFGRYEWRYDIADGLNSVSVRCQAQPPKEGESVLVTGTLSADPFLGATVYVDDGPGAAAVGTTTRIDPLWYAVISLAAVFLAIVVAVVIYSVVRARNAERSAKERTQKLEKDLQEAREKARKGSGTGGGPSGGPNRGDESGGTKMMVASLDVVQGPEQGTSYPVVVPQTRIGRASGMEVLSGTADQTVSASHATISATTDGAATIHNSSRFGTKVNGSPIGDRGVQLHYGDTIECGGTRLVFRSSFGGGRGNGGVHRLSEPEGATRAVPVSSTANAAMTREFLNAKLVVVEGVTTDRGRELPIKSETTTIGRREDRDLHLSDDTVSRVHADVLYETESYRVQNHSDKGTKVNGERIVDRRELRAGDRIQVGSTVIEFRA